MKIRGIICKVPAWAYQHDSIIWHVLSLSKQDITRDYMSPSLPSRRASVAPLFWPKLGPVMTAPFRQCMN